MVVNKFKLISTFLLLGLTLQCCSAANNLVQLDLKKSSADSVDVTLVTTENYNDNIMVRKKSDNKYVILIPQVHSSGFSNSSLNGVKDLVSDIDVKTVNDTSGGYTKVTLITTKPLDIKTKTQKSAPITAEQQEYKTLIAQANSIKNNIAKPEPKKAPKTEVTINKATVPAKSGLKKEVKTTIKEQPKEIKLTEITPEKIERAKRQESLTQLINETQKEITAPQEQPTEAIDTNVVLGDLEDIKNIIPTEKISSDTETGSKFRNIAQKPYGKALGITLLLMLLLNLFKKKNNVEKTINKSQFMEQLVNDTVDRVDETYSNIINNSDLSWREKYELYMDKSAKPVARANNKGNYLFIKKPVGYSDEIEQKRIELENLIQETSEIDNMLEPEIVEIATDEDAIRKTIKLKSFGNNSLKMTKRNQVHSRFKRYEQVTPAPQKTVNLGKSKLHTNPRSLQDANLKISAVDEKRLKFKPQDYVMSSVDEFFSILDKEESLKASKIIQNAENSLVKMKKAHSNPIKKQEPKTEKPAGLIVKSEYNLDDNRSFYLVNNNGQNALIGKVNDEVFVLKKFDNNITDPIKVRRDKDNVYMVKAGDFKSLVEVNDEKMGVLIEL